MHVGRAWISQNVISVYCSQVAAQLIPDDISLSSSPSINGYYSSKFINRRSPGRRSWALSSTGSFYKLGRLFISFLQEMWFLACSLTSEKKRNNAGVRRRCQLNICLTTWVTVPEKKKKKMGGWGGVFVQIVLVSSAPITNSAVGLQGGCLNKLVFNARADNWHSQAVMTVMTAANCDCTALSLWGGALQMFCPKCLGGQEF